MQTKTNESKYLKVLSIKDGVIKKTHLGSARVCESRLSNKLKTIK